jgi:type IX secretion system PorP/SprF family membrane protein
MKNKPILIALTVIFIGSAKALAQDAVFTQWENMTLYFNPALTGNFEGLLRLSANHRNQWASFVKDNPYRTSAISAEYKFSTGSVRKISFGALALRDKAGNLDFKNTSIIFSSSVIQHLGNPDNLPHSIAIGFNVGMSARRIDFENAQWPGMMPPMDINEKNNFADVSAGLLWQYRSNSHFSFNLGTALHHLNRPNISFYDSSVSKLYHRFNLHGHVEIPLVHKFSIVPSFLFSSQGPSDQLLFGLNNRWYPKLHNPNFVQLGFFAKTTKNYNGRDITIYVVSATVEINSFLAGFSFDRIQPIESNAYEFSVGYTFRVHGSKGTVGNLYHPPPGIIP